MRQAGVETRRCLRRTITPYIGQSIIFSTVSVFCVVVAYRTSQWTLMMAPALIWALFAILFWMGWQYRVSWDTGGVYMQASGLRERRIAFDRIGVVKIERAGVGEFLNMSRPFRRVAIYGHKHDPDSFIDVSLRHFRLEDIRALLAAIRTRRPDLAVPSV